MAEVQSQIGVLLLSLLAHLCYILAPLSLHGFQTRLLLPKMSKENLGSVEHTSGGSQQKSSLAKFRRRAAGERRPEFKLETGVRTLDNAAQIGAGMTVKC